MRQIWAGAVAVVAILGVAGTGPALAESSDTGGNGQVRIATSPRQSNPGNPDQAIENYTKLEAEFDRHPDRWGGAFVDGDSLVVRYFGVSEAQARKTLESINVRVGIRLEKGQASYGQLIDSTLRANRDLKSSGAGFATIGPDWAAGEVAVEADRNDPRVASVLGKLNAPKNVKFAVRQSVAAKGLPKSRYYDTVRYFGGSAVKMSNGSSSNTCSIGLQLVGSDGYAYALTAGHCYQPVSSGGSSLGTRPTLGRLTNSSGSSVTIGSIWGTSTTSFGNVSGRVGDTAVYRLSGGRDVNRGTVYVGTGNTTIQRNVGSLISVPVGWTGSNVYTSGASGYPSATSALGQISPTWVSLDNQCTNYANGQNFCGITIIEDVSECVSGGDSGGLIYRDRFPYVDPIGIISGSNGQGPGPTNCRNYYTPNSRYFHKSFGISVRLNGS